MKVIAPGDARILDEADDLREFYRNILMKNHPYLFELSSRFHRPLDSFDSMENELRSVIWREFDRNYLVEETSS